MFLNLLILVLGLVVVVAFKGVVPISITMLGIILYKKIKLKENPKLKIEHIGILIFLLMIGLSFINSIDRGASLVHYKRIIRAVMAPILIYNIFPFKKKYFDYGFTLGGLVFALMGISQYYWQLIPYDGGNHMRIDGGYSIWHYSYFVSFICVYIFNLFILEKEKRTKILYLLVSIVSLLGVLLSNTRSAWLATILGVFICLLTNKKIKEILIITLLTVSVIFIFRDKPIVKKYLVKAQSIVNTKNNTSNLGRFEIWKDSYNLFKENPILGVGIANYDRASEKKYKYSTRYYSAHSDYLGLLSETGIVGSLGFLMMLFLMFKGAYRRKKLNILLSVTSVFLFTGIFESNMNKNNYVYIMYFILYGMINYGEKGVMESHDKFIVYLKRLLYFIIVIFVLYFGFQEVKYQTKLNRNVLRIYNLKGTDKYYFIYNFKNIKEKDLNNSIMYLHGYPESKEINNLSKNRTKYKFDNNDFKINIVKKNMFIKEINTKIENYQSFRMGIYRDSKGKKIKRVEEYQILDLDLKNAKKIEKLDIEKLPKTNLKIYKEFQKRKYLKK